MRAVACSITEGSELSGVKPDFFTDFFRMRGYIRQETNGYSATLLGIEKGCTLNDENHNAQFTMEAIRRVKAAFSF